MDKKRVFMITSVILIVLFIGWFYIEQLGLFNNTSDKKISGVKAESTILLNT